MFTITLELICNTLKGPRHVKRNKINNKIHSRLCLFPVSLLFSALRNARSVTCTVITWRRYGKQAARWAIVPKLLKPTRRCVLKRRTRLGGKRTVQSVLVLAALAKRKEKSHCEPGFSLFPPHLQRTAWRRRGSFTEALQATCGSGFSGPYYGDIAHDNDIPWLNIGDMSLLFLYLLTF